MAVKMLAASFGPEVVEQKALEDVEWLSSISEAARVITVEVRGGRLPFRTRPPPGERKAIWQLLFVPHTEEGILGMLSKGAFHEAMLGGLWESLITTFAGSRNSHDLKPGAYRQPVVED